MGYYTEQGKQFDIFSPEFPYKVRLLYGDKLAYIEGDLKPFQITYYCEAHEKTYRIRKSEDKFFCDEYILDESDLDDLEEIIGIGLGVEITAEDLDEMFGDWENFGKKLKPVNDETIGELLEAVPELKEPMPDVTMEDMHTTTKSYKQLLDEIENFHKINAQDVENALDALICNLKYDKKSRKEDATKINGKYERVIKRGEIWKINNTRGVNHEVQSVRPAIVISDDDRNAVLGTIVCITFEGHEAIEKNHVSIKRDTDIIPEAGEVFYEESRAELTQVFALDRARFIRKRGELTTEKFNEVLAKFKDYYQLPDTSK